MDFQKMCEVISETVGCDLEKVTREAKLEEDLGADSLAAMELVMALEEAFEVEIDDAELERALGTSCADYITAHGEDAFRIEETAVLGRVAARSALVISCGGGVVARPENYGLLHQNARIVMLDRPLDELSSKGRPVSQRDGIAALAERRLPLYRAWADAVVASRATPPATAQSVRDALSDI